MTKAAAQRRNPAQERSKITVKAIVEAAARVFAARGCAPATTNAIAAKAGVSVGSLYQYFPDKMALLRAVRAHSHETLMATLATACRAPAPTLETALRAVIAAAAAHHREHAALERIFSDHLPGGARPASAAAADFQAALRELLRRHQAELQVKDFEQALFFLRPLARSLLHAAVEDRVWALESGEIQRDLLGAALAYLAGRTTGPVQREP